MKKALSLFLLILLIISTFSCKNSEADNGADEPPLRTESITLEDVDIKKCVVALSSNVRAEDVAPLSDLISRYTDCTIPVKPLSEITDADEGIILIGAAALDGSHEKYLGLYGYRISAFSGERVLISVDFSNNSTVFSAVKRLVSLISKKSTNGNVALTLKEREHIGFSFEDELPAWTLKEESTSIIADGVTYTYQRFVDDKGLPYRAHVLKIDPAKAYLYTGTPSDKYDYKISENSLQTVMSQINAAIDNGNTPVAAVNADFFVMSGTSYPLGLFIKEGNVIAKHRGRPWCGYTFDGQFVCGASSLYDEYEGKLRTAVGASHVLISDGAVMTNNTEGPHPRTLAGVSEDGTIILAVIDGRQLFTSNGAVYARCAMFMLSHGAYNAVNLDGGGSSTMIISQNGGFKTVNSPSDFVARKVYNSLLVIPKDK